MLRKNCQFSSRANHEKGINICKICELIHASTFVSADVTYTYTGSSIWTQNVYCICEQWQHHTKTKKSISHHFLSIFFVVWDVERIWNETRNNCMLRAVNVSFLAPTAHQPNDEYRSQNHNSHVMKKFSIVGWETSSLQQHERNLSAVHRSLERRSILSSSVDCHDMRSDHVPILKS